MLDVISVACEDCLHAKAFSKAPLFFYQRSLTNHDVIKVQIPDLPKSLYHKTMILICVDFSNGKKNYRVKRDSVLFSNLLCLNNFI